MNTLNNFYFSFYYTESVISKPCNGDTACQTDAVCNAIGVCECKDGFYPQTSDGSCAGKFVWKHQKENTSR